MDPKILSIHRRLDNDLTYFSKHTLLIKDKRGMMIPFIFNRAQNYTHFKLEQQRKRFGRVRAYLLKGRQLGMSTYVAARYYQKATRELGKSVFILSHDGKTTGKLFDIVKRYRDNAPGPIQPVLTASNKNQLKFEGINSDYSVGTAGSADVGRGGTVQFFHGCVSGDTLIPMRDGSTKPMFVLTKDDEVLTSSGEWTSVKQIIYTGEKQTYSLKCWNSGEAIHITADHKVLTDKGYRKLSELTTQDFVAMPKIQLTNKISYYEHRRKNKIRSQNGGTKTAEYFKFKLNYNFGYLLGYYLAEGHVKDSLGYLVFVYHKNEKYIRQALRGTFGVETSIQHKHIKNKILTTVYGTFITTAINDICGRVRGKHIPDWFFDTNINFVKGVIQGYFDGDGSKTDSSKITASTIHERIARPMRRLVIAVYGACSINRHKRYRYFCETKDIYLLRMTGNTLRRYQNRPFNKRIEKSYFKDGQVFCRIKSIIPRRIESVWDIEVNHSDHNYQTTTGIVSNSEIAFWEHTDEIQTGVLQSVADIDDTEIILESTANGMSNLFYKGCMEALKGIGDYILVFIPWFWQDEYEREPDLDFTLTKDELAYMVAHLSEYSEERATRKICWMRYKIIDLKTEWKFKQEYPATPQEAFQTSGVSLISAEVIMLARKSTLTDHVAPLVLGIDPARKNDRGVISFRRGREFIKYFVYKPAGVELKDTEAAAIIARVIDQSNPKKAFIDKGYGHGIIDILEDSGYNQIVQGVSFSERAIENDIYLNKRAEMFMSARDWLYEKDVSIPDDDVVQIDFQVIPEYRENARKLKFFDPKDKIIAACGFSYDIFDSFILTFAYPVAQSIEERRFRKKTTYKKRKSPLTTLSRVREKVNNSSSMNISSREIYGGM